MASIFDKLSKITPGVNSDSMGQAVEEMVNQAIHRRHPHERRWYDNNFFDDGYHFRIVSKNTGRVIDTINKTTGYVERAIPRASRQIRGVTNLLFGPEPYPVVYPERIIMEEFTQNGQFDQKAYEQAMDQAKHIAKLRGLWLSTEWEDEQHLFTKMIDMMLLSAKNSIGWIQVYSDTKTQKIITEVYDAFDIICFGDRRDIDDLPFITKTKSMDIKDIKSSSLFDEEKVAKLSPDNKYATSEIKDAYMRSRYGSKTGSDTSSSVIVKETFIKEYLTNDNWQQVIELTQDNSNVMEGKNKGDMVMRHPFSAGGITLADEYVDYDNYPFAEFRFEPGPLYQVPFIERFIPQNKSVDVIVTRLEKWVNTMVVGVYQQRKGENFQVSNFPGGQVMQYEQTPLQQMNQSSVGATPFQVIELLNKYIDEQGASTSALNQLPGGVKSGVAIESVKSTEYANLKIPTLMLKKTIKRIAELMLERAHKDFLKPTEVSALTDGEPQYFDVIGKRGMDLHKQVGSKLPQDVVSLDKDVKVRIDIEPGLGLTMEGKKEAMQQIITFMTQLYQEGFLAPEALSQVVKKFLEVYGYGSTEEFMEAVENGVTTGQMSDNQIKQMQIAIAQTLKDLEAVGPANDDKLVTASKMGTLQSLKDAGLLKNQGQDGQLTQKDIDDDYTKIYKDAPADIQGQIEQKLGLSPSQNRPVAPSQADTATKLHGMATQQAQTDLAGQAQEHQINKDTMEQGLKAHGLNQQGEQAKANTQLKTKEISMKGVQNGQTHNNATK